MGAQEGKGKGPDGDGPVGMEVCSEEEEGGMGRHDQGRCGKEWRGGRTGASGVWRVGVGEGHLCDTRGNRLGVVAQLRVVAGRATGAKEESKTRVCGVDCTSGRDERMGEEV